jgi:peptidoglycan/xylan/chitin deacetylase (PgdA/CDA1 family)
MKSKYQFIITVITIGILSTASLFYIQGRTSSSASTNELILPILNNVLFTTEPVKVGKLIGGSIDQKIATEKTKKPNVPTIIPDIYNASAESTAPFLTNIETKKPVIFIGIDDGVKKIPEAVEFFKQRKWPTTLFLNQVYYKDDPEYFKQILATGSNLGNHTYNHPNLNKLSYEDQKKEICEFQNDSKKVFGVAPKLFRPPYGNYTETTLRAARDCGIVAVIGWKARVDEGKVWYQVGDKLRAGEIVLMHFRPQMMDDLKAFEEEITRQGLTVANLEDWIK